MDRLLKSARHQRPSGKPPKAAEYIALDIVRDIVDSRLKAGDPLASEAEMARQYGYSRPTIREALRLLEFQGLIYIRPGAGAGTVVGTAEPQKLSQTLTLFLHLMEATYSELLEAWKTAEGTIARFAAKNPNIERKRLLLSPFIDTSSHCTLTSRKRQAGMYFHQCIEELADNRVLALPLRAIGAMAIQHIVVHLPWEMSDDIIHDHSDIARAVIDGDQVQAETLTIKHFEHVQRDFEKHWPKKVGERLDWASG